MSGLTKEDEQIIEVKRCLEQIDTYSIIYNKRGRAEDLHKIENAKGFVLTILEKQQAEINQLRVVQQAYEALKKLYKEELV